MRELNYERGTVDINDELKPELMKMFKADGIVFATPIWWSGQSSHIQAIMERMDPIYNWAKENKHPTILQQSFWFSDLRWR